MNFGLLPMVNDQSRLGRRFYDEDAPLAAALRARSAARSTPPTRSQLGLVTAAPDDIDWDDEIRIAIEERAALSPDALTGMEANLRFGGAREPWRRASSAGSPPGRTGSSTVRTPSARRARSRSTARARRPQFDWKRV